MKRKLFLGGLYFLLQNSVLYCPVKTTPLDSMWSFLSKTLQFPDEWSSWSDDQREKWTEDFKKNPTLLMKRDQKRDYINILGLIHSNLERGVHREEYYLTEVQRRLEAAGSTPV